MSHEFAHQNVLGVVGVLVLVDQDVPESSSVVLGDLRVALQHRHRFADQVVEVQRVGRPQSALILAVDIRHDAGEVIPTGFQRADGLLGVDQLVLEVGDRGGQQTRRVPLDVDTHVAADHQQQPAGIVGVVDGEVGVQAGQQRRLVTQDAHAGGVEGRHPHIAGPRAHQLSHPLAHLGSRFVGEGDGQDLTGAHVAGGQQVGDPAGEHGGLPRAGPSDDQQRGPLVQHRLALLGIEPVEQFGGARRGPEVGGLRSHDAPNTTADRRHAFAQARHRMAHSEL
jgi:hypothetical protein